MKQADIAADSNSIFRRQSAAAIKCRRIVPRLYKYFAYEMSLTPIGIFLRVLSSDATIIMKLRLIMGRRVSCWAFIRALFGLIDEDNNEV